MLFIVPKMVIISDTVFFKYDQKNLFSAKIYTEIILTGYHGNNYWQNNFNIVVLV